MMAGNTNSDIMSKLRSMETVQKDTNRRVRKLEDWKIGLDAVDAFQLKHKPIISLEGIDWKAIAAIIGIIVASIYAAIKQVK